MHPLSGAEVLVLRLVDLRPDGPQLVRFTEALRRKVMAVVPDPLPPVLHGHSTDGTDGLITLSVPGIGRLRLRPAAGRPRPRVPGTALVHHLAPDQGLPVCPGDSPRRVCSGSCCSTSAMNVGRAVLAAATVRAPVRAPARRLVNVGSVRATAVRQVATELIRLAGGTVQLEEGGDVGSARLGEVSWQQADVMATRDTLAWSPHDTLLDAVNAVLAGAGVVVT